MGTLSVIYITFGLFITLLKDDLRPIIVLSILPWFICLLITFIEELHFRFLPELINS